MPRGAEYDREPRTPPTLVAALRDATQDYEVVTDESLVGAVQNWLEGHRLGAYDRYKTVGARVVDDLKRFAEAGL